MNLIIVLFIVSIFFDRSLACNCSSQAAQDLASLQAAVQQISNHTAGNQPRVNSGKKAELRRSIRVPSNTTGSNHPLRRGCAPYWNPETQEFDGTYVCDKDWPEVQLIQGMFRNTGLVTNPSLLPAYYTGWTNDQMEDPLWKACVLDWLWKYTGSTPPNPNGKLAPGFYWYWNALPTGWFEAQHDQIEEFMYNAEDPDVPADDWAFPDGADVIFQNCVSEAFAKECVHDTIVLFAPKGYVLGSEGETSRHWWKIEFPILTNNPIVQTILRVDPRPVEEGGDPCDLGGIWNRNVVPGVVPRPIVWTCPTTAQIKALLGGDLGRT